MLHMKQINKGLQLLEVLDHSISWLTRYANPHTAILGMVAYGKATRSAFKYTQDSLQRTQAALLAIRAGRESFEQSPTSVTPEEPTNLFIQRTRSYNTNAVDCPQIQPMRLWPITGCWVTNNAVTLQD